MSLGLFFSGLKTDIFEQSATAMISAPYLHLTYPRPHFCGKL